MSCLRGDALAIRLPPLLGGTTCRVRRLGRCPRATVEIAEPADNPGRPASAVFELLAPVLLMVWFPCGHEPVWVEHQPHRALADLLLRDVATPSRHRVLRTSAGIVREPMTLAAFRALVRDG